MSSHRARTLYRIDPQTSNVQAEIEVDMLACGLLLTTADAVWVTSCEDGPSKRIDPDTDEVVEETAAGVLPPVTAEDGSTWQVRGLDQLVDRIDPATGAAIESVPTGPLPWFPVAAFGAVWLPNVDGTITRVDTASSQPSSVVLSDEETSVLLAVAGGSLWAVDGISGQLWRIGPDGTVALSSVRPIPPSSFYDINLAVADDHLFLRSGNDEVWEVDAATAEVIAVYPASGAGGHVAVGDATLWVAAFNDQVVRRIPLD